MTAMPAIATPTKSVISHFSNDPNFPHNLTTAWWRAAVPPLRRHLTNSMNSLRHARHGMKVGVPAPPIVAVKKTIYF